VDSAAEGKEMTDRTLTKATENGRRMAALHDERAVAVALYRTHVSGTSMGRVHRDVYVGTVRWVGEDDIPEAPAGFEFSVGTSGQVFRIDGWISQRGDVWMAEDAELGPVSGVFESPAKACAAITKR
jgi:hypothetical protein